LKINIYKNENLSQEVDLGLEVKDNQGEELVFLVGRSDECHIVLDDIKISREHAKIVYSNEKWEIKRLSGFGNILVNGNMIDSCELKNGDIANISNYVLNFSLSIPEIIEPVSPENILTDEGQTEALPEDSTKTVAFTPDESETPLETIEEDTESSGDEPADFEFDEAGEKEESSTQEELKAAHADDNEGDSFDGGDFEEVSLDDNTDENAKETESAKGDDFSLEESEDSEEGDEDLFGEENSEFGSEEDGEFTEEGDSNEDEGEFPVSDSVGEKTQVLSSFSSVSLDIFGEYAPYDKYLVDTEEVYIGRDPSKCQIVLNDPEVSSVHTVIRKNNIFCTVEDLQSANGTLLNGARINKAELNNNDEFIIGSTTFTVRVTSEQIHQEEDRMMPVDDKQIIEVEEIVEVVSENAGGSDDDLSDLGGDFGEAFSSPDDKPVPIWKDKKKRKYLIGGLLAVLVLFMDEGTDKSKKLKKGNKQKTGLVLDRTNKQKKRGYTPEEEEFLAGAYELAKSHLASGRFTESLYELDKIFKIADDYKKSKDLRELAKEGLAKIEEVEKRKREELERQERVAKIKKLVEKAREAVTNRERNRAQSLFEQILILDPENYDVPQFKIELKQWVDEQDAIARAKAQKEADRKRKLQKFNDHKKYYLLKHWYKATLQLESFLAIKDMDEDLISQATQMLNESRSILSEIVSPLLGKARSFKEGQDLKSAYEIYKEILNFDPNNIEAINEMVEIRDKLNNRAKKIYREAIVSESLSLFSDAKEKLQEVLQLSPSDSEYFRKASTKLKNYLD